MSSAPAREPIVTRTYSPAPDQCVRALELLLKKPASKEKEGGPPTAPENAKERIKDAFRAAPNNSR